MDESLIMLGVVQIDTISPKPQKHHHINLAIELDGREFDELNEAMVTLNQFKADSQLFTIVVWNFEEFVGIIGEYLHAYRNRNFDLFNKKDLYININRCFLNLLSSIRSYLDHIDNKICDRFGKDDAIRENFQQYCSHEYDTNFSYRFIYQLRNYAQHRGFPINDISLGQRPQDQNTRKTDFYLKVQTSRDGILEDYNWKKLTNEIQKLPEKIDIIFHTDSSIESLKIIHARIMEDFFGTLQESAKTILKYADRVSSHEGVPALFTNIKISDGKHLSPVSFSHQLLPIDLAQRIAEDDLQRFSNNSLPKPA